MEVTLDRHLTADLGEVITINKNGIPCARLRQIGVTNPDVRLEWLVWSNHKQTQNAIQFPCCSLSDVTIAHAERMIARYKL